MFYDDFNTRDKAVKGLFYNFENVKPIRSLRRVRIFWKACRIYDSQRTKCRTRTIEINFLLLSQREGENHDCALRYNLSSAERINVRLSAELCTGCRPWSGTGVPAHTPQHDRGNMICVIDLD